MLSGAQLTTTSVRERRRGTLGLAWASSPSSSPDDVVRAFTPDTRESIDDRAHETGRLPFSPKVALTLLLAGVVAVVVALFGLSATGTTRAPVTTPPGSHVAAPVQPPGEITIAGAESVEVHMLTYAPHEYTSWHRHTGLHAVAVLSGTLTIFGPDCEAHHYGPGESYVGGREVHMARNESDEPLVMAVTYMFPGATGMTDFSMPALAPPGCAAA